MGEAPWRPRVARIDDNFRPARALRNHRERDGLRPQDRLSAPDTGCAMSDAIEWWKPSWRERFFASLEDGDLSEEALPDEPLRPVTAAQARARPMHVGLPTLRRQVVHGGALRPSGGSLSRFAGTSRHADRRTAALQASHPAMRESRTLFPSSVKRPADSPRILVSGHNSAKIGKEIMKGPWRGLPVFTVTLEERASCPSTCSLLAECYGNAMPFARRHRHGPELVEHLDDELRDKARRHPSGFAVRLHVLGDFYSSEYLLAWLRWMNAIPQLHVWGYTAHSPDTFIGRAIGRGNDSWAGRWAFRFSGSPKAPAARDQAATIWRAGAAGRQPEGIVCPAQTGDTAACATCGLCWSPNMRDTRILFIGHGMRRRGGSAAR
jgi:hypothetical protein